MWTEDPLTKGLTILCGDANPTHSHMGRDVVPRRHVQFATNDQHSYVRVPPDSPLKVGDVVRLGLSHPCTAFDKWSLIPVLDDASAETPVVIDLVRTYF